MDKETERKRMWTNTDRRLRLTFLSKQKACLKNRCHDLDIIAAQKKLFNFLISLFHFSGIYKKMKCHLGVHQRVVITLQFCLLHFIIISFSLLIFHSVKSLKIVNSVRFIARSLFVCSSFFSFVKYKFTKRFTQIRCAIP